MVTVPLTIDGTSELTSQGTPEIVLSNGGGVATGIVLKAGLGDSKIEGLQFLGFTGPAILVQSAGNTIGGTATARNVLSTTGSAGCRSRREQRPRRELHRHRRLRRRPWHRHAGRGHRRRREQHDRRHDRGQRQHHRLQLIGGSGVSITGSSASSNVLEGNFIGTNAAGADLGGGTGVEIEGASNNAIGGTLQRGQHDRIQWLDHPGSTDRQRRHRGRDREQSRLRKRRGHDRVTGIDLTGGGNHSANLPPPDQWRDLLGLR